MVETKSSLFYRENQKIPFEYQEKCLIKILDMFRKGINPILNFDTGLGKTFTSLELIKRLKNNEKLVKEFDVKKVLIVCKASNIKDPWIKDIDDSLMSCLVYAGPQERREEVRFKNDEDNEMLNIQGYDILLMSYDILANDIEYVSQTAFDLVIFDEIHNQFDVDRITPNIQKIIGLNYRFAVALTATPMKNTVYEPYFLATFMQNKNDLFAVREKLLLRRKYKIGENSKNEQLDSPIEDTLLEEIKEKYSDCFITVSKYHIEDESPLPPIHSYRIILPVEDCIRKAVGEEVIFEDNFFNKKEHLLTFPENYPADMKLNDLQPGIVQTKYIALELILRKILARNEKVIVFSQYVKDLEYLSGKLERMNPIIITGAHNHAKREQRIKYFSNPSNPSNVLLLSLNAFAEGINLQCANNVVFMNPWYNPSKISQAKDRVYRTGQKKEVNVYYLCTDTVLEERTWEIQEKKTKIINELFFKDVLDKLPVIETFDYRKVVFEKDNDFEQNTRNFLSKIL